MFLQADGNAEDAEECSDNMGIIVSDILPGGAADLCGLIIQGRHIKLNLCMHMIYWCFDECLDNVLHIVFTQYLYLTNLQIVYIS